MACIKFSKFIKIGKELMKTQEKVKKVKAMIFDIDGVLTDARMGYSDGPEEVKFFNARDGHGLKLAKRAGFTVGLLSGRGSKANQKRAKELDLDFLYENIKDKGGKIDEILSKYNIQAEECMYMGDDLIDIPVLRKVGLAVTVSDAMSEVSDYCDICTEKSGGYGAVREIIEIILKEQGKWENQISKYIS